MTDDIKQKQLALIAEYAATLDLSRAYTANEIFAGIVKWGKARSDRNLLPVNAVALARLLGGIAERHRLTQWKNVWQFKPEILECGK